MTYETEPVPPEPQNGAGPSVANEEEILAVEYGEPNEEGVYGAVSAA